MQTITETDLVRRLEAQGVRSPRSWAFRCPHGGTVQSAASIIAAGVAPERADRLFGMVCIGRWTNVGPRVPNRYCDLTLVWMFTASQLQVEIMTCLGIRRWPCFPVATAAEAQALERELDAVKK